MFCTNCGTQIEDGTRFCPECGAKIEAEEKAAPIENPVPAEDETSVIEMPANGIWDEPVPEAPAAPVPLYAEVEPAREVTGTVVPAVSTTPVFVLGIIGCVLAWPWFSTIAGIIISAVNLGKARKTIRANGGYDWKTRVGKILSIVGLIAGIVMTIVWIIYFAVVIVLALQGGAESVLEELL